MIDLKKEILLKIISIVRKHFPLAEIRAFGSRVNGNAKSYSDLDLALLNEKIDFKTFSKLKIDLEESDIPIRVDIVDYAKADEEFRKVIDQKFVVI